MIVHIIIAILIGAICAAILKAATKSRQVGWLAFIVISVVCFFLVRHQAPGSGWQLGAANSANTVKVFEHKLQKNYPVYQVLAHYEPVAYAKFITHVTPYLAEQDAASKVAKASSALLNKVFFKYLSKSPDAAALNYLNANIALYTQIEKVSPITVIHLEYPQLMMNKDMTILNEAGLRKYMLALLAAKSKVIEQGARQGVLPQRKSVAEKTMRTAVGKLYKKYGKADVTLALSKPTSSKIKIATCAKIIIDFYRYVQQAGDKPAAITLRFIGQQLYARQAV